jgi:hypothetical protein
MPQLQLTRVRSHELPRGVDRVHQMFCLFREREWHGFLQTQRSLTKRADEKGAAPCVLNAGQPASREARLLWAIQLFCVRSAQVKWPCGH